VKLKYLLRYIFNSLPLFFFLSLFSSSCTYLVYSQSRSMDISIHSLNSKESDHDLQCTLLIIYINNFYFCIFLNTLILHLIFFLSLPTNIILLCITKYFTFHAFMFIFSPLRFCFDLFCFNSLTAFSKQIKISLNTNKYKFLQAKLLHKIFRTFPKEHI